MGDAQFSLLMDAISQNYQEPSSFTQEEPAAVRPGHPLPMASSPPEALGILDTEVPTLNVHVHFAECAFLFESPVPHSSDPEMLCKGKREAEMFLDDATVTYKTYDTGSSRVQIVSKGVLLNDARRISDDGTCVTVLTIDPVRSGDGSHLNRIASETQTRWRKVWETLRPREAAQRPSSTDHSHEDAFSRASGFVFDFIIQQREASVVSGPMVMEMTFLEAAVVWPYFRDLSLVDKMAEIFRRHYTRPSCLAHPENADCDEWTYINCIFKRSKLFVPLYINHVLRNHSPRQFNRCIAGQPASHSFCVMSGGRCQDLKDLSLDGRICDFCITGVEMA